MKTIIATTESNKKLVLKTDEIEKIEPTAQGSNITVYLMNSGNYDTYNCIPVKESPEQLKEMIGGAY